jgi:hypothetical protein
LVLEIEIKAEPLVQEAHMARLLQATGRCVSYDPGSSSKREMKKLVRTALKGIGPSPEFPIFKGRRALLMQVTYEVANMSKTANDLQAFVEDVLEGLVYQNKNLLCDVYMRKRLADAGEPATCINIKRLSENLVS